MSYYTDENTVQDTTFRKAMEVLAFGYEGSLQAYKDELS